MSPAAPTQKDRQIRVGSPLGTDAVLFRRMSFTERLGRPFEGDLELLSEDHAIKIEDVLAQPMSISLRVKNEGERFFHGIVTRFSQVGVHGRTAVYRATLRPWLWFLTRTADCRIFQEKTAPDIIKEVFRDHGFTDFREELSGTYRTWEYCVQYRETDFNFVSRLMEQEGIYYFFEHEQEKHTLVLADSPSAHAAYPDYGKIPFHLPGTPEVREREHVHDVALTLEVQPGAYALTDFDFKVPKKDLAVTVERPMSHNLSKYEIYDYPGEYVEGEEGKTYVQARLDELQSQYHQVQGAANARGIATGHTFELEGHPTRDDLNAEYLFVAATHDLVAEEYESGRGGGGEAVYACQFTAIPTTQSYRSPRITPKPMIQGPQTAMVVGKAGEEIWTDEHGRVKCQFHWDRYGKSDENSSCWIRVAQLWAGKSWGGIHVPRIGQEVVVEFLEGDPDRPIVTGRVYNGDARAPFPLPDKAHVSGIKSDSTPGGGGNNEISFDDTKGTEKINIHGQYDMATNVGHDQSLSVGNNRSGSVGVDDDETIGSNQTVNVGSNQTLIVGADQSETIGSNQTLNVAANQTVTIGANQTVNVGSARTESIGSVYQLSVAAAMNTSIGAALAEEIGGAWVVEVGGLASEDVGVNKSVSAGSNISHEAGSNYTVDAGAKASFESGADFTVKAGGAVKIEAGGDLVLKAGGAQIVLSGGNVTIKGSKIALKGSNIDINGSGGVKIKGATITEN